MKASTSRALFAGAALFLAALFGPALPGQDATPETLVVGTKSAPPFVLRSEGSGEWSGISIELWRRIARRLDLDFRFEERPLDELVSGLGSGLDASVAALTVTPERDAQIDFSHPFHPSGLGIAVPAAEDTSIVLRSLGALFSTEFLQGVAALIAILAITGAAMWMVERDKNDEFGGTTAEGVGNGFWWSAVTMTTVGYGDKAPKTPVGRGIALVWMFASVITISGFTAAIASSLTVSGLSSRIRGPEDLPKVTVGTVVDSTSEAWLRSRGIDTRTRPTIDEALDMLAKGSVGAVVYDAPILRYATHQREQSAIGILPSVFERQDYAIGLPLGSPLRKDINRALLEVIRADDWQRVLDQYLGAH